MLNKIYLLSISFFVMAQADKIGFFELIRKIWSSFFECRAVQRRVLLFSLCWRPELVQGQVWEMQISKFTGHGKPIMPFRRSGERIPYVRQVLTRIMRRKNQMLCDNGNAVWSITGNAFIFWSRATWIRLVWLVYGPNAAKVNSKSYLKIL